MSFTTENVSKSLNKSDEPHSKGYLDQLYFEQSKKYYFRW